MTLLTEEYGKMKCELWTIQKVDAVAKERNDCVKFLGIYSCDGVKHMLFSIEGKTILAEM